MSIAGNLKTMELSELLQWLSVSKKTGTLQVESAKVQKQIFFQNGRVISSASTDPAEHLGAFLVSHGFITEMELSSAIKMQASNKMLLGKILTTVGAIAEEDLHRMLRLKAEEAIYDVFTWKEGDFRFFDQKLPDTTTMVPLSLDIAGIVLEGMQRLDEWNQIRAAIPNAQYVPVQIYEYDDSVMTEGAQAVLALIDDDRSVADICHKIHAHEFHVCRILARQLASGRIKMIRPRGVAEPEADAGLADGKDAITGEALIEAARQLLDKKELEAALRHVRAARALEPDNSRVTAAGQKIEDRLRAEFDSSGLRLDAVPVLAMPMEELSKRQLSPQEGFAITRIDGSSDLASLIKLGPMPALDAQLLFWKLARQELIRFVPKR
jgi:hypothetical protein